MSKQEEYAGELARISGKVPYLRRYSGLPGPRGNLELVQAAADVGEESEFRAWIAEGAGDAPTDEFMAVCGVVGFGRLVAEGNRDDLIEELRRHAADARWRVREGVAMALQRVGDADVSRLMEIAAGWAGDRAYVQRAAVAGVAEPRLLKSPEAAARAVEIVDRVTASLAASGERRSDEFRTLRQALAYCWSVVVAADPEHGKPRLELWAGSTDPDVRWLVKENLKKARLVRLDPVWVAGLQAAVGGSAP